MAWDATCWRASPCHHVDSPRVDDPMGDAVEQARVLARDGDTVLMAPACASMDQFSSYAHRGEAFPAAVGGNVTTEQPKAGRRPSAEEVGAARANGVRSTGANLPALSPPVRSLPVRELALARQERDAAGAKPNGTKPDGTEPTGEPGANVSYSAPVLPRGAQPVLPEEEARRVRDVMRRSIIGVVVFDLSCGAVVVMVSSATTPFK